MKTSCLFLIAMSMFCLACNNFQETDQSHPLPTNWGPDTFQIDAEFDGNGNLTSYFVLSDTSGQLSYSLDPIPESKLPFRFYAESFQHFPEIIISSPYPIRPNWFRVSATDCIDPGSTATGIEFVTTTAREKDYLLIARLDSTYWECLSNTSQPFHFSFQILDNFPVLPSRFEMRGFYDQQHGLLHLNAHRDTAGIWHPSTKYQVFQEPGPKDFTIHISGHPQLSAGQTLLQFNTSMLLTPHSLWIGLAGECLDQADWEPHQNRLTNHFLLDVVIPDHYLDCLTHIADGFEFKVEFFQYIP